jgi:alanine dehydrogenase
LANLGLEQACERHPALRAGVNTYNGYVTHGGVAQSQGRQWRQLAPVE